MRLRMSAICNKSPKLVSWAFYALYAFLILQASICLASSPKTSAALPTAHYNKTKFKILSLK